MCNDKLSVLVSRQLSSMLLGNGEGEEEVMLKVGLHQNWIRREMSLLEVRLLWILG